MIEDTERTARKLVSDYFHVRGAEWSQGLQQQQVQQQKQQKQQQAWQHLHMSSRLKRRHRSKQQSGKPMQSSASWMQRTFPWQKCNKHIRGT